MGSWLILLPITQKLRLVLYSMLNSIIIICDFHREQARLGRWVKDKNHRLSTSDAEWLLSQL